MGKLKYIISLWFTLTSLFFNSLAFSQPIWERANSPMRMGHWKKEMRCWSTSELALPEEKQKELQLLKQNFLKETQLLRAQLITKRLELREMLTNPAIREEAIRPKSQELVDLQNRLEERAIEYLIKVRNYFTSEQLPFWCPEEEFPFYTLMKERHGPMKPIVPKPLRKTD